MATPRSKRQKTPNAPTENDCTSFETLYSAGRISKFSLEFARAKGFTKLTPVQREAMPLMLGKKDVAAEACTGSGKTLTFLIPVTEILVAAARAIVVEAVRNDSEELSSECIAAAQARCRVGAVCLAPTRELAIQIYRVLSELLSYLEAELGEVFGDCGAVSGLLLTGGKDVSYDEAAIRQSICSSLPGGTTSVINPRTYNPAVRPSLIKIIVATPGRLSALIDRKSLSQIWSFRDLEVLVLDEADRLLLSSSSFELQLSNILAALPKQRLTGLFSATLSAGLDSIVKTGMHDPVILRICASSSTANTTPELPASTAPPSTLRNYYVLVERQYKLTLLLKFLQAEVLEGRDRPANNCGTRKCIVFFLTCCCVNYYYALLKSLEGEGHRGKSDSTKRPVTFYRLCGKMNQRQRSTSYQAFLEHGSKDSNDSNGSGAVLLATDVAARGLDIPGIDWVVQFEPPQDPAMLIHRIGRTARAGHRGESLVFLTPSEQSALYFYKKRQVDMDPLQSKEQLISRLSEASLSRWLPLPKPLEKHKTPKSLEHAQAPSSIAMSCQQEPPNGHREVDFSTLHALGMAEYRPPLPAPEMPVAEECLLQIPEQDYQRCWELARSALLNDRELLLRASASFVAYLRAYKEHQLQFIFPFRQLEIGAFSTSLGLLRLPRVKEILGRSIDGFIQSSVDPKLIPFKDKKMEAQHQRKLQAKLLPKLSRLQQASNTTVPLQERITGIKEAGQRESRKKTITRTQSGKHATPPTISAVRAATRTRSDQKKAKRRRVQQEWDMLHCEDNLFKKLRSKKISEEDYDRLTEALIY